MISKHVLSRFHVSWVCIFNCGPTRGARVVHWFVRSPNSSTCDVLGLHAIVRDVWVPSPDFAWRRTKLSAARGPGLCCVVPKPLHRGERGSPKRKAMPPAVAPQLEPAPSKLACVDESAGLLIGLRGQRHSKNTLCGFSALFGYCWVCFCCVSWWPPCTDPLPCKVRVC